MKIFKEIEFYLSTKNITEVIDIQMNEPSVGISEGWVIMKVGRRLLEISYDDMLWHLKFNSTKKRLLSDCFKTEAEF